MQSVKSEAKIRSMKKNPKKMKIMPYQNRRSTLLLFFFTLVAFSLPVTAESSHKHQLMLMGGGVKTCSSAAQNSCLPDTEFSAKAKSQALFQLSDDKIKRVISDPYSLFSAQNSRWLPAALHALQQQQGQAPLTFAALRQAFRQLELEQEGQHHLGADLYQQLSAEELDFIFDYLEIMVIDPEMPSIRLKEQAALLQTNDEFSISLYQRLVAEAQKHSDKEKPLILLVTASSRDPFAAVDFYLNALEQAGATAQWLPIHGPYHQSQQLRQSDETACEDLEQHLAKIHGSYNRAHVYPDLMDYQRKVCQQGSDYTLALLERADGILFNGGDQSLTLQALRLPSGEATQELATIKQRLAAGQLIVAGTSAGTAVMSGSADQAVPMITNGDSAHALIHGAIASEAPVRGCAQQQRCPEGVGELFLTYTATGGAALFPWGILDTHFSERGREGRLIQLALATSTRFGFGVDEATALLVSVPEADGSVHFEVQGQGGVYIADTQNAAQTVVENEQIITGVATHYLTHGDDATLKQDALNINFASWKQAEREPSPASLHASHILNADHYQQLAKRLCSTQSDEATGLSQLANHKFQFRLAEQASTRQALGFFAVSDREVSYCSYQNVRVDITTTLLE
ncbi:cyanophycinase [Alkalimonas collagenimarina]|uniref:Cyanophycinase n=1 Tax=Alkalimonas collagenimarina TaxID=400390 RepID=A0ABT9GV26_9GAMM|nr:cyanophycinase [Alkalimonas collagenimarina]MDP4534883.1 cyanophycinase [Alkalimonas collagenimarina]